MSTTAVYVGIGSNLSDARFGSPRQIVAAAVSALADCGICFSRRSRWYASAPVPPSDQPDFVNGVVQVATSLDPVALLRTLHEVEARFGRERGARDAARILDLDLLAYGDCVRGFSEGPPTLPHPRLHRRAFVLVPLVDLAPDWRHQLLDRTAAELLASLPPGQRVDPLPEQFAGPAIHW